MARIVLIASSALITSSALIARTALMQDSFDTEQL